MKHQKILNLLNEASDFNLQPGTGILSMIKKI